MPRRAETASDEGSNVKGLANLLIDIIVCREGSPIRKYTFNRHDLIDDEPPHPAREPVAAAGTCQYATFRPSEQTYYAE